MSDSYQDRIRAAIAVLPHPINAPGAVQCPHCGKPLHYERLERFALLACETEDCTPAQLMIPKGAPWPVRIA